MTLDEKQLWTAARPSSLPPEALRRVRGRLASSLEGPSGSARRWPSWPITALLLTIGGAAGASVIVVVDAVRAPEVPAPVAAAPPVPVAQRTLAPARPAASPPPRFIAPAPPLPSAPPAPVAVESLAAEARLLGAAVRALRQEDNPAKALALLDDFSVRFPRGSLGAEATLARIDSLGRLGRDRERLEVLDRLRFSGMPHARELRVLRGELRLRTGRVQAAADDFEIALGEGPADQLGERALYGRASCRSRQGDDAGARADLRLYLARHPQGARAAEIRARFPGEDP
jgi:tetratricopeptide (TPR) repeat protein